MHEKAVPIKTNKAPSESKTKPVSTTKTFMIFPPASPKISQDPYYGTDRYRLAAPLFPNARDAVHTST